MINRSLVGVPASLETRGFSLPFTTSALKFSRLRVAKEGGFEALLPGLSGGKGTYVIPWEDLPEIVSMSLHDRAIFRGINNLREVNAHSIRSVALETKKMGYNGPEEAVEAKNQVEQEYDSALMIHFCLVSEALAAAQSQQRFSPNDLLIDENMQIARKALRGFANSIDLSVNVVMDRFKEWANLLRDVGSHDQSFPGYLINRLARLAGFIAELEEWADDETPDVIVKAQKLQDMGELVGRLAFEEMECLNGYTKKLDQTLSHWEEAQIKIEQHIVKLFGILDGWNLLIKEWEAVSGSVHYIQRDKIFELVKYMPLLPTNLLNEHQLVIMRDIVGPGAGIMALHEQKYTKENERDKNN